MEKKGSTWKGTETLPLMEIMAVRNGFQPIETVVLGPNKIIDLFDLQGITCPVLVRLADDGNPNRTYVDVQILILDKQSATLHRVCGELLGKSPDKIELASLTIWLLGEDIVEFFRGRWEKEHQLWKKRKTEVKG